MYKLITLFSLISLSTHAQYITIWKTDNEGTSANNQITIPATGTNYTINWVEVGNLVNSGTTTGTDNYTLTFPSAGTYQISITKGNGSFDRISFNNQGDQLKLLQLTQWGDTPWTSMEEAYSGCKNLTITATDKPNLNNVTSTMEMFEECSSLTNIPGIDSWDMGTVENMAGMFFNASSFNAPLGNWDVSNVTNMSYMFRNATAFNQPLNNWDVSQVAGMINMFANSSSFNQTLGNWNIRMAMDMSSMLFGSGIDCKNFTYTLQGWAFNNNTASNIRMDARSLNYGPPAVEALTILRTFKRWTITVGHEVECAALDVSLIRFMAKHESGKVNLQWATASETDHDYFELERSADARTWIALTKVKGAGTVTTVQQYTAKDLSPLTSTSYYRLKIVDFAGKAEYSNIQSVYIAIPETQYVYPNPAQTSITLTGTPMGTLKIYNILGQEVMQTTIASEKTEIDIHKLPVGVYTIKMENGWNKRLVKK